MSSQAKNSHKTSQETAVRNYVPDHGDRGYRQTASEADLWEPPFERWIRMADDLLRDWPGTSTGEQSHAA